MRFMKKFLSVVVALSLCASLAAPAFAVTYDISKGDVTIGAESSTGVKDGETGSTTTLYEDDEDGRSVTITQSDKDNAASNTVTVEDEVKDVDITLKDVDIKASSGKDAVSVGKDADVDIKLEGNNTLEGGNELTSEDKINVGLDVGEGAHVDLDLNGGTLDGGDKTAVKVEKDASLTMTDSGSDGKIKTEASRDYAIRNEGTLKLEDGTVEAKKYGVITTGSVEIGKDANVKTGHTGVVVNGGELTTEGVIKGDNTGVNTLNRGTVNVDGGTVDGATYGIFSNNSEVNVNNGVITSSNNIGVIGKNGSTVEMTGGKIESGKVGMYAIGENTTVTVSGGTIDGKEKGIDLEAGSSGVVSGDNTVIKSDSTGIFIFAREKDGVSDKEASLTVNGGRISGKNYGISGNGTTTGYSGGKTHIVINGGTVEATGDNELNMAIYHPQDGTLIIGNTEGGNPLISGYSGIQMCAGTAIIYGGRIMATGTENKSGEKPAAGTIVDGKKVSGDGLIPDAAAVSVVDRKLENSGYANIPKIQILGGSFGTAEGNDAVLAYGRKNTEIGIQDWPDGVPVADHVKLVGGAYSTAIPDDYLGQIDFGEKLFEGISHKADPDTQVICIATDPEKNPLPYYVGYLTGTGKNDISRDWEDTENFKVEIALTPEYQVNGVKVEGVSGKVEKDDPAQLSSVIEKWEITSNKSGAEAKVDGEGNLTVESMGDAEGAAEIEITATLINGETVAFTVTVTAPAPDVPDVPVVDADDDDDDDAAAPGTEITDEAVPLANGPVTRAEFINYLWQRAGQPEGAPCTFPDVPEDHQYVLALGWAQEHGIAVAYLNAEGHEDGTFEPDELVTVGAAREFLTSFAAYAEMLMPEMKALTGPDEELLFTCDDVMREFFGD